MPTIRWCSVLQFLLTEHSRVQVVPRWVPLAFCLGLLPLVNACLHPLRPGAFMCLSAAECLDSPTSLTGCLVTLR